MCQTIKDIKVPESTSSVLVSVPNQAAGADGVAGITITTAGGVVDRGIGDSLLDIQVSVADVDFEENQALYR